PEARSRLLGALAAPPASRAAANRGAEPELCLELAVSYLYTLEFAEAATFAARAAEGAGGAGRLVEGTARALLAFVHASSESPEGYRAARAERARAAVLLDGLHDDEMAAHLDSLYYLGWAERLLERYDEADAHLGRAIAVAEAGGGSQWLMPTVIERAKVLAWRGRLAEARELAGAAAERARASGTGLVLVLALSAQVAVFGATGDIAAARAAAQEAIGLASGAPYHHALARRLLGLAYLEGGDTAGFFDQLALGAVEDSERDVTDGLACRLIEARCQAELARGRPQVAAGLARQAQELAGALGLPASAGYAARARAWALANDRPGEAVVLARRAVELFGSSGAQAEAARARVLVSELLARCGQAGAAMAECRTALEALSACGAERAADQARLALRRLSRAGAATGRGGTGPDALGTLSRREREVAELVAQGRSNRDIALRLVLSENTVESHLRSILAKLGVKGRGGVARAMTRGAPP
ncbi:MAG: LuxR C-terminal-related transcriptional regulator, partial [Acidimicrobiales bacterium]